MSERQDQFSGTREVLEAHKVDSDALYEYMQSHVEGFQGPIEISQFKGGQSNPTYLIDSPGCRYVLRRKPPGKLLKSAHAVEREFRVISALYAANFPVPRPFALCEDDEVIGTTFFIMAFVEGRIFWDLDLPDSDPQERRAIYDNANQTIAKLHNLDVQKIGLDDFGRPGNYFARQISRWTKQYEASKTAEISAMQELIDWLPENIPEDEATSVVHGDYRLDNMIIHPTEPKIIAVLDWELSTIGDPLGDFTYHLMAWQMPDVGIGSAGLRAIDVQSLGIPSEDEYVEMYCSRTARNHGIEHRDFYSAYNFFRIAAISQGIAGRVRDGTAASVYAEQAAKAVQPLAEIGWQYSRRAS
jgi:aminoglycoside phosphotransferase (APT) family kinase protein